MIFHKTNVHGAWLIEPEPHRDTRGSFSRILCLKEFAKHGINFEVAQANLAHTMRAGTIRGLHYQQPPNDDQKLVRCLVGAIHDVIIDTRPASPSRGAVYQVRLDAERKWSLFVPGGVAHGYQALGDGTEVMYLTDRYYSPGLEKGIRFDDPELDVAWPLPPVGVSQRDQEWELLGATTPERHV